MLQKYKKQKSKKIIHPNRFFFTFADLKNGDIAQLVEQWTENPCVPGSNPGITTKAEFISF
jgi:hypothetical protein